MLGNFSNPNQILEEVGLSRGMVVADLGAGSGHYSMAASRMVGDGKVYALEVQKDLVERLKIEFEKQHLINISPIWCNIEKVGGTKLGDRVVDLALVCNVLFQIEDRKDFLKELFRIIKPQGRILLVDWTDSYGGLGPTPQMVIREEEATSLLEQNGFKKTRNVNAGAHHYGIIFTKE